MCLKIVLGNISWNKFGNIFWKNSKNIFSEMFFFLRMLKIFFGNVHGRILEIFSRNLSLEEIFSDWI